LKVSLLGFKYHPQVLSKLTAQLRRDPLTHAANISTRRALAHERQPDCIAVQPGEHHLAAVGLHPRAEEGFHKAAYFAAQNNASLLMIQLL